MRITDSAISFQSQHTSTLALEASQSLQVWGNGVAGEAVEASAMPQISGEGQAALAAESSAQAAPADDSADAVSGDPRLLLIRTLVEMLTGQKIRVMSLSDVSPAAPASNLADAESALQSVNSGRAGWGIAYDARASISETEQTTLSAQGVVRTADGREISFTVGISMSRSWSEEVSASLRAGDASRRTDPLVLNFGGTAAQLTDVRFAFDLEGNGQTSQVAMLGSNSAYLAFDANGNGKVDSGKELFGPTTGSGFGELAQLDADGNGWVDEGDAAYASLLLWRPGENGGTLQSLKDAGVGAIATARQATPFALRGAGNADLGAIRESGVYLGEDGQAGTVQELDLTV